MEVLEKNFIAVKLKRIYEARKCSVREFASDLNMPYQTLLNYSNGSRQPGWELLKYLHDFGINLDWFMDGAGEMYRANRDHHVVEMAVSKVWTGYQPNSTTTPSSTHVNTGVMESSSDTGGRSNRLCQFARYWMETRAADDQAWLEKQIERAVPEYADWKKREGR